MNLISDNRAMYAGLIVMALNLCANAQELNADRITGKFVDASITEFAREVESQSVYRFYFDVAAVDSLQLTFDAGGRTLIDILDSLFSGPRIYYSIDNHKNVFLTTSEISTATRNRSEISVYADAIADDSSDIIAFRERKIYQVGTDGPGVREAIVSGIVKHADSGEPVTGATIRVQGASNVTTTNSLGHYSLKLAPGTYVLIFTNVGLKRTKRNIRIYSSGTLNLEMQPDVTRLQEVVVQGETSRAAGLQLGTEMLNIHTLRFVPSSFGEVDVLKAMLTLPGVKTIGEASTGFNVRGGAADQNLILINGSTIYNPFHFFGFFSAFNPDAIENVELFKASVPAGYGGRLSSVIRITSREGDKKEFKGSAGIGLLTGRVNLEGPVVKNKVSFSAGARKTYSNWIFNVLPESSGFHKTKASFHDVNLAIDADAGTNDRLRLSAYVSRDLSNLNTDTTYTYSNRNLSLQWNHDFNDRLRSTTIATMDHFDYGNSSDAEPAIGYAMTFALDQGGIKTEMAWELNPAHSLNFGLSSIYYKLNPGTFEPRGSESVIVPVQIPAEQALESAVHIEDDFTVSRKLSLRAGIRYSFFNYLGDHDVNYYTPRLPRSDENLERSRSFDRGEIINTYHGPEARLSARFLFTENFSIKAGYTVMRQYIHMLSNSVAMSPTDIWKLSDPNIKPQLSEQLSLGFYKNLSTTFETSVEGYWKTIRNYLDYKSGAVLVLNPAIEQDVISTKGKAYGAEFLIKKPKGNFNGWISYTWSRTFLIGDDPIAGEIINRGKYYPANYDKPHDFNFTGNQKLTKRFNISLNMSYSSGRPVTVPIGVFNYGGSPKTLYSGRNSYRIPDYFRTDISINLEGNHKVRQFFHNSWTFGVYNVTGRKNPYSVYYTREGEVIRGYKIAVFGSAIPFINYNIRF